MTPSRILPLPPKIGSVVCAASHRAPTPLHERGCAALPSNSTVIAACVPPKFLTTAQLSARRTLHLKNFRRCIANKSNIFAIKPIFCVGKSIFLTCLQKKKAHDASLFSCVDKPNTNKPDITCFCRDVTREIWCSQVIF